MRPNTSRDMARDCTLHPMRMSENFEAVLPCDRHKRHAGGVRHPYGQGGRSRDGDNDGAANCRGFLHHLNRHPAGENNNPLLRRCILADQGARELIECVMASDVFSHSHQASSGVPKARGVHGTSLVI